MQELLPGWQDPVTYSDLVSVRRAFHRLPEAGWTEFLTTSRIASELAPLGLQLRFAKDFIRPQCVRGRDEEAVMRALDLAKTLGVPSHLLDAMGSYPGLIARWDSGKKGKTVALRFELDAMHMAEPQDSSHLPAREGFRSTRHGLMHAAGHDGNLSVAIALAKFLHANRNELSGQVLFIFQPAEEGTQGAYAYRHSDILEGVDVMICAHLDNDRPLGTVVTSPTQFLCTTKLDFNFEGVPSHAGIQPQIGHNALLAGANAAMSIMAMPRHGQGMTRVNVGTLVAGEGRNIVPSHAKLEVEVRGENVQINRDLVQIAIERARGSAISYGVQCHYEVVGEAESFESDHAIAQLLNACASKARGVTDIQTHAPFHGSDDGTLLLNQVQAHGGRAGYFLVGTQVANTAQGSPLTYPNTQPMRGIDLDERALVTLYDIYAHAMSGLLGLWSHRAQN